MRFSTWLTLGALGAAAYYVYQLSSRQAQPQTARVSEPIIMWFETVEERSALCEGAD